METRQVGTIEVTSGHLMTFDPVNEGSSSTTLSIRGVKKGMYRASIVFEDNEDEKDASVPIGLELRHEDDWNDKTPPVFKSVGAIALIEDLGCLGVWDATLHEQIAIDNVVAAMKIGSAVVDGGVVHVVRMSGQYEVQTVEDSTGEVMIVYIKI
ncbi:hypothetical protein J8273_3537 [Carpediemonas membranifera]|uniref:Uncharacterized protein n=1 Tax=Carpediemonas membranifera TaxID=201153 RepID=A0A8J6E1R9_9EUKA|nr:hypothetical protein J8273_3537 [Carpediemonas membranifera]|eukprot:KAG9393401.1 hypothetical protein J8273_3537 [Carpediemonas membranifera]